MGYDDSKNCECPEFITSTKYKDSGYQIVGSSNFKSSFINKNNYVNKRFKKYDVKEGGKSQQQHSNKVKLKIGNA